MSEEKSPNGGGGGTTRPGWRRHLPSRGWLVFGGVVTGLAAAKAYDYWQCQQLRASWAPTCAALRATSLPTATTPVPPLVVVTEPSHWARYWYRTFVQPLLDESGTDARVVEVGDGAAFMHAWTAYQAGRWEVHQAAIREVQDAVTAYNRTWLSYWFGKRRAEDELPPYPQSAGLLILGSELWGGVIRGLAAASPTSHATATTSATTTPSSPLPASPAATHAKWDGDATAAEAIAKDVEAKLQAHATAVERAAKAKVTEAEAEDSKASITPLPSPFQLAPLPALPPTSSGWSLPPVGYVSATNQTGFAKFPQRIYGWFHERATLRQAGTETMRVMCGQVMPFPHVPAGILPLGGSEEGKEEEVAVLPRDTARALPVYVDP